MTKTQRWERAAEVGAGSTTAEQGGGETRMCLPRRVQIRSEQGDAWDPNYSEDTTNTQSGNFQRHRDRF